MELQLGQDFKISKRTKRPRAVSPFMLSRTTSSTTSSSAGETSSPIISTMASSIISNELTVSTEEEEDMANCLILLAGGQRTTSDAAKGGGGVHGYQCKTCNKCFPSFQALGGHRASHKKPKANSTIEGNQRKKTLSMLLFKDVQDNSHQFNNTSTVLSLDVPSRTILPTNEVKSKVHECSICGAEFSSGQALGGHMRRHRSFVGSTSTSNISEPNKTRNILQLDLNLPAPEDDQPEFSFASNEQVLSFSASPLVGYHL